MNSQQLKTRARIAALTRHHPNEKKTVDLARNFKAERLAEYIERVVDSAPPLTESQRDKLAALLLRPVRTSGNGHTPVPHSSDVQGGRQQ